MIIYLLALVGIEAIYILFLARELVKAKRKLEEKEKEIRRIINRRVKL